MGKKKFITKKFDKVDIENLIWAWLYGDSLHFEGEFERFVSKYFKRIIKKVEREGG